MRSKYAKYCLEQNNCNVKVSQEDIISWVGETWYDHKISAEIVSKSFKKTGITLNLDGGEDELFIGYNKLLEDDQEMVEEVQEIKQLNLKNKLLNVPHNSQIDQKESEIEQEDEFKDIKPISIKFVQHKDEEQKDELSIAFKLQENEEEEKEDKEEDEEKEEEEKEEVTEKKISRRWVWQSKVN